jgi:hypothetical protein
MRAYEYDLTVCNCGCGLPVDVAHNAEQPFMVEEEICYARRAIEKVRTQKHEAAKRAGKGDGAWDAGLKLYARPVSPEEVEEIRLRQEADREAGGPRLAKAKRQATNTRQRRMGAKA